MSPQRSIIKASSGRGMSENLLAPIQTLLGTSQSQGTIIKPRENI